MLAARAAFAAQPGVASVSVPLDGGSLSVTARGGWCASAPVPEEISVNLYLPCCPARTGGLAVAHIGQSLHGRIATENGDSRWVTGEADLLHCHRMRALADAIIVGSGRPGIALTGDRPLDRAFRPRIRRFNLGAHTLFDCDLYA